MGTAPEHFQHQVSEAIRSHALSFPQTDEGTSCVNRAFKSGGKNFVFVGEKDDECKVRLKLGDSIDEVTALAASDPDRYQVGKGGWTLLTFPPDDVPPQSDLDRWVTESFRLLAPKKVVAEFDD